MKCDTCLEARCVVSENGFHHICSMREEFAMDCLLGKKDYYVRNPIKVGDDNTEAL